MRIAIGIGVRRAWPRARAFGRANPRRLARPAPLYWRQRRRPPGPAGGRRAAVPPRLTTIVFRPVHHTVHATTTSVRVAPTTAGAGGGSRLTAAARPSVVPRMTRAVALKSPVSPGQRRDDRTPSRGSVRTPASAAGASPVPARVQRAIRLAFEPRLDRRAAALAHSGADERRPQAAAGAALPALWPRGRAIPVTRHPRAVAARPSPAAPERAVAAARARHAANAWSLPARGGASHAAPMAPVPMEWRAATRAAAVGAPRAAARGSAAPPATPPGRPAPPPVPVEPSARPADPPARTRPAAGRLDAAEVDRLADTVIQRIERRIRIERERRGM